MALRWSVLLLLLTSLVRLDAADEASQVPDPLGLGERLALIDFLQTHGQSVAPGAQLPALRAAYRDLTATATPSTADAETSARDEAVLLLWRTYNVVAPEHETLAQLQNRLVALASSSAHAVDVETIHERADAGAAAAAAQLAPSQPPETSPAAADPTPAVAAREPARAAPSQGEAGGAAVQEVTRPGDMTAQVHAYLIAPGPSPILLVCLNPELLEPVRSILSHWPAEDRLAAGITSTVIIHGHSSGTYFAPGVLNESENCDLSEHLRRNRLYYETLAGSRERKIIDFAVMTGCNPSGSDQEAQLRDGFGYRPVHRVFTAPGSLDAAAVVLPAIMMTGTQPYTSDSPYHASYTWYHPIPVDGTPCTIACYAAIDDDALDVKVGMHRFLVSPAGCKEQPAASP